MKHAAKWSRTAKQHKAFTLIELLVVIAIIALLLAIVMPSLNMAKEHARRLTCAAHLRGIGQVLHTYAEEHNGLIPKAEYGSLKSDGSRQQNPVTTYMIFDVNPGPPQQIKQDTIMNMGPLWTLNLIQSGEIFYCPSNMRTPFSYDWYGGKERWPYPENPNADTPDRIRVGYSYLPQSAREKMTIGTQQFPLTTQKLVHAAPGKAMCLDTLQSEQWWSHRRGSYTGANILYTDASVDFRRNSEVLSTDADANQNPMDDPLDFRALIRGLE